MTRKSKIFLTGGWGYGNRGDNAILAGTLSALSSLKQPVELHITSFSTEELKVKHNLDSQKSVHALLSFRRPWNWPRWLAVLIWRKTGVMLSGALRRQLLEMQSSDLIVFGGGGYFNDTWKDAFPSRIVELEMARESLKPYVILGQTIGPFSDYSAKEILPSVLKPCSMVAYRDRQSIEVLNLAGLSSNQVAYTADMAHLIPPEEAQERGGKTTVGLMLQGFRKYESRSGLLPMGCIQSADDYLTSLVSFIQRIHQQRDVHFVLISSTSWDEKFMRRVQFRMSEMNISFETTELESSPVQEFIRACQSVDIMISTNMHPIILASLAHIPTIAISYHFKLDDYMERIGRQEYCHRIDDFNPEEISDQAFQLIDTKSHLSADLAESINRVIIEAQQNAALIRQFLSRGPSNA